MAKPTKNAPAICFATGVVMAAGAVAGLVTKEPLWAVAGLAPITAYEVYRTEGESTRWASWVLMAALILEAALLILKVDLDLAQLLGRESETVAGYTVPLGPVTVVGPVVMAVTAIILLVRTRGRYTRWLAAGIIVGAGALIYILDPSILGQWLGVVLDAGLPELQ
ncbi:MAG: hypothetical protein R6X16_09545 [Anaerolineae bacterium]